MTQPKTKKRAGSFEICLWENKQQKEGREFTTNTISLKKSYKVNEEWKDQTINLDVNDLQKAIILLQEMQKEILLKETEKV